MIGPWEETLAKSKEFKTKQAEREQVRNEELFAKFETALVEVVVQDLR